MQSGATDHQANIEQRENSISESSYLTPVFVRNESQIETRCVRINENEVLPESEFNAHDKANKETFATLPSCDLKEHVYIEIVEDDSDLELANLTAENGHENIKDINIRRTETLCETPHQR